MTGPDDFNEISFHLQATTHSVRLKVSPPFPPPLLLPPSHPPQFLPSPLASSLVASTASVRASTPSITAWRASAVFQRLFRLQAAPPLRCLDTSRQGPPVAVLPPMPSLPSPWASPPLRVRANKSVLRWVAESVIGSSGVSNSLESYLFCVQLEEEDSWTKVVMEFQK